MVKLCVLAGGSSGNCIFLSNGKNKILLDCGLSGKQIEQRISNIGESTENIKGIIITHEHSDHIKGAGILARRHGIKVYGRKLTLEKMSDTLKKVDVIRIEKKFVIDDFEIETFPISHDAVDPVGLLIKVNNYKIGVLTDTGVFTQLIVNKLSGLDCLILESNYDEIKLKKSDRPIFLKQRVKGRHGHLSNKDSVKLMELIDKTNLKYLVLHHISEEHNSYKLAFETMNNYFQTKKININLSVSYQSKAGKIIVLEGKSDEVVA